MQLTPGLVENAFMATSVVTGLVIFVGRHLKDEGAETPRKPRAAQPGGPGFRSFQRVYLCVYYAAVFSDWLQGPYVYALYEAYGFSQRDNAILFVAGYGSSMVFGTVVGSLADWTGRKRAVVIYCLTYTLHNLTKHANIFCVLLFGRVMGGIATSLLFSVFESWMVCEHTRRGFDLALLSDTFSWAVFGNSVAAVLAGFVAQIAADYKPLAPINSTNGVFAWGYCAPFDVSNAILVLCAVLVKALWRENVGQQGNEGTTTSAPHGIRRALEVCAADQQLVCCGAVCSFFEASMFIFIFQWTPALTDQGLAPPPYGMVFATFMVPCMLGSALFSIVSRVLQPERIGQGVVALALGSGG
ncbi:unnamed protein product, partial [Prorocentrum cordatum]